MMRDERGHKVRGRGGPPQWVACPCQTPLVRPPPTWDEGTVPHGPTSPLSPLVPDDNASQSASGAWRGEWTPKQA